MSQRSSKALIGGASSWGLIGAAPQPSLLSFWGELACSTCSCPSRSFMSCSLSPVNSMVFTGPLSGVSGSLSGGGAPFVRGPTATALAVLLAGAGVSTSAACSLDCGGCCAVAGKNCPAGEAFKGCDVSSAANNPPPLFRLGLSGPRGAVEVMAPPVEETAVGGQGKIEPLAVPKEAPPVDDADFTALPSPHAAKIDGIGALQQ
mmetsp:Transcript_2843/g.5709  ORF Transcript_2843/g.5709 Transcript_2843/m.5709 type:complete len:204 (+) Transcript_2843:259-870(+)